MVHDLVGRIAFVTSDDELFLRVVTELDADDGAFFELLQFGKSSVLVVASAGMTVYEADSGRARQGAAFRLSTECARLMQLLMAR